MDARDPLLPFRARGAGRAVLGAILLSLAACPAPDGGPDDTDPEPPPPISCDSSCLDTASERGRQLCYACRCKSAMDGWLPSAAELQCANGEQIQAFEVDADGELDPADPAAETCANPSLLYATCADGGRLGQLTRGDVTVKWICRYNQPAPADAPYDDVGAILYNARTGATCWFDDEDGTGLGPTNFPDLDLMASDEANRAAFERFFYVTQGASCTGCHDADPFLLTPYLGAVDWRTGPWTSGSFRRVTLDGGLVATGGRHLAGPDVAACTACHRLGAEEGCRFALDALGVVKSAGHQGILDDASGTPRWDVATWMPPDLPAAESAWQEAYGAASEAIARCCADPGDPTCDWRDVP